MAFDRILVPVDYSDHSLKAVGLAADLARRIGTRIDIVHVWDRPTYVAETILVGKEQRPLGELIRENAEREMAEFLAKAESNKDVLGDTQLIAGDPAAVILKEVERGKYDLVVMGTHGRTGFAHLLLGSVAEKLVRYSRVPVLTVPRAE